MKTISLNINGMHCAGCKTLIESEVGSLVGVKGTEVDLKRNTCEVEYDEEKIGLELIIEEIRKIGYEASAGVKADKKPVDLKVWLYSISIVVGLYLIFLFLEYIGILSWLEIDQNKMGYGIAFLVGIVASLSTCLMVVGAVIISFSAKYQTKGNFYERNVRPHLLFQLGRILTFFLLGGVLGLIGDAISLTNSLKGWFTFLIAVIIMWLALSIMGILPSISKFGFHLPHVFSNKWDKLKNSKNKYAPILLGGLTFFLPCGFTQSMQIFAMASGSFLTGAFTLLMFALGTSPVLIGLGIASNRFRNKQSKLFSRTVGIILIIFSLYVMSNGLALAGYNVGLVNKGNTGEAQTNDDLQTIEMSVNYRGFEPSVFNLKKGVKTRWIINGDRLTGCTSKIIVPTLGIEKSLVAGENIIEFTPDETGTINFSCWMGMVRGKFVVSE